MLLATAAGDEARDRELERAFAVFAALWAAAALFEYARTFFPKGQVGLVFAVVAVRLAAAWVLARPSGVARFLALDALLVAAIWAKLPQSPNHGVFVALAALTWLLAWAWLALRQRRASVPAAALYAAAAPALRWELLALYFWRRSRSSTATSSTSS